MSDFSTLFDIMRLNSRRYSIRNAFLLKNGEEITHITYRRFYSHVRRLATVLLKKNGGKATIALCLKNSYEWVVSYFAAVIGAGTVCPLSHEYTAEQLLHIFEFADIHSAVVNKKIAEKLLEVYDSLPADFLLICTEEFDDNRVENFDSLLEYGKSITREGYDFLYDNLNRPEDPAVLMFTSGTLDEPKGVILCNKNLVADILGVSSRINVSYDDRTLCTLPLYHSYQCMVMLVTFYIGGNISFSRSIHSYREDLQLFRPTILATVPLVLEKTHKKILHKLNELAGFKRMMLTVGKIGAFLSKTSDERVNKTIHSHIYMEFGGELKYFIVGGAGMNEEIVRDYYSFGFPVILGYGLTECSPIVACNSLEDHSFDSVGKPLDGVEVFIESPDEDGIGEICVRGDIVMNGYFRQPELTAQTIVDGALHTGDLGCFDENGRLHITGRIKNVIIGKNGKNIYPEELESALRKEPVIMEALIFCDDEEESQVTVEIVPDKNAISRELEKEELSGEEIEQIVATAVKNTNKFLPAYKHIKKIRVSNDSLSAPETHKIRRRFSKNSKNIQN